MAMMVTSVVYQGSHVPMVAQYDVQSVAAPKHINYTGLGVTLIAIFGLDIGTMLSTMALKKSQVCVPFVG